jgi:hypothetical protein
VRRYLLSIQPATTERRSVGFHSIHERLDTTTPGGMFVFHVFAALAIISSLRIYHSRDLRRHVDDTVLVGVV